MIYRVIQGSPKLWVTIDARRTHTQAVVGIPLLCRITAQRLNILVLIYRPLLAPFAHTRLIQTFFNGHNTVCIYLRLRYPALL